MAIEEDYEKPTEVDKLVRALKADGFKENPKATATRQEWCDSHDTGGGNMSADHPYRVLHTLAKDDVHVVIEQNTARDGNAVITYDPIAFVTVGGQDLEVEERFSSHHASDVEAVLEHADMCAEGVDARAPHETKYQKFDDLTVAVSRAVAESAEG